MNDRTFKFITTDEGTINIGQYQYKYSNVTLKFNRWYQHRYDRLSRMDIHNRMIYERRFEWKNVSWEISSWILIPKQIFLFENFRTVNTVRQIL